MIPGNTDGGGEPEREGNGPENGSLSSQTPLCAVAFSPTRWLWGMAFSPLRSKEIGLFVPTSPLSIICGGLPRQPLPSTSYLPWTRTEHVPAAGNDAPLCRPPAESHVFAQVSSACRAECEGELGCTSAASVLGLCSRPEGQQAFSYYKGPGCKYFRLRHQKLFVAISVDL